MGSLISRIAKMPKVKIENLQRRYDRRVAAAEIGGSVWAGMCAIKPEYNIEGQVRAELAKGAARKAKVEQLWKERKS